MTKRRKPRATRQCLKRGHSNEPRDPLSEARRRYAREWSEGNARPFVEQGHYEWMAGFLTGSGAVLEIGAGDGSSTAALLSSARSVISVDENPACLRLAETNLAQQALPVRYEQREQIHRAPGGYRVRYTTLVLDRPHCGALLVEGDPLTDPGLAEWLIHVGPFDAVACWLIGTYFEHIANTALAALPIRNPSEYREVLLHRIAVLASRILAAGGRLQFVDRGVLPKIPGDREAAAEHYRRLVRGTGLVLSALDHRPYNAPGQGFGMAVRDAGPSDDRTTTKAFISAVFLKPR